MKTVYSINELVQFAILIEKNGASFYAKAAEKTKNKTAKELFLFLRDAEREHEAHYSKILKSINEGINPGTDMNDEYRSYLKALVDNVVFKAAEQLPDTDLEVIDNAINKEKDSILFYMEMAKAVVNSHQEIIDEIIREEQLHILKLLDLKEAID